MTKHTGITIGILGLFTFLAFGVLSPNPFGNNPDIIYDESYFLTSSLSAIEKVTLPGWEFSPSGSYYGGPQAYVDTIVMVPVLGTVFVWKHFSVVAIKAWIAFHTGDLLHILRLVNGMLALGTLAFCFWYFRKRHIPRPLALSLVLLLLFLVSNVLFMEFLHTAKMWVVYNLVVAVASAFFIAQEYYLKNLGAPFLRKETYVALMLWSGVVAFFQNYFGIFSIILLAVYAIFLRHFTFRDIWEYVKKQWYLFVLFGLMQISFVYRAVFVNGYNSFSNMSVHTENHIDWAGRLYDPLVFAITGQPLVLIYAALALAAAFLAFYKREFFFDWRRRRLLIIACVHPIIVYLFFHVAVGMNIAPRYGIMLSVAGSFSAVLLLAEFRARLTMLALGASIILFFIVNIHAINLYWCPSSETVLLDTLIAKYNSSNTVFIADVSARRLTLPSNERSLLLGDRRVGFERFKFLLQHLDLVREEITFKPLTLIAYSVEEEAAAVATFKAQGYDVWIITTDCSLVCSAAETASGTCFQLNVNACGFSPQEPNGLPVFLSATQLGRAYIVRKAL